jgi:hypothetical protein
MKIKTTHPTKFGASTNTRNFFQKSFILLAILAFTSWGTEAIGQTLIDFNVNNQANCDYVIKLYNGGGVQLGTSFTSTGGAGMQNKACFNTSLGTVNRIEVSRLGCSPESFYATSTTSGEITYVSKAPTTCILTCCAQMTCAGSGGGTQCGGSNDYHYLIELFY